MNAGPSTDLNSLPFSLHLDSHTFVSGEVLSGHVTLDVAFAQRDHLTKLTLEFIGMSHTTIVPHFTPRIPDETKHTFTKLALSRPLWTTGSKFPNPDSHTVHLPFHLPLPEDLPSSMICSSRATDLPYTVSAMTGSFHYNVIVRGDRQGLLRRSRSCERIVTILSGATPEESAVKALLNQRPWAEAWRSLETGTVLLDGGLSHAELELPDLPFYPLDTLIPYRLHIFDKDGCTHLDEVPDVKLSLVRLVTVRAGPSEASCTTIIRSYTPNPTTSQPHADRRHYYSVKGTLRLSGTPSLVSHYIFVSYSLKLRTTVPGCTNPLTAEWPIKLCPAAEVSPPAFGHAHLTSSIISSSSFAYDLPENDDRQLH